jgi:hypothetical protein
MPIVIELGRETKNVNPFIEPLGEALRGKWRKSNLPLMNLADAEVAGLPDLPGYQISVDENARKITVLDPLMDDPQRDHIRTRLARFFKHRVRFNKVRTFENETQTKMHEWLLTMKRLVEAGNARLVSSSDQFPPWVEKELLKGRGGDDASTGTVRPQPAK